MALLDLVEYLDPTGNVLAARVPPDGSGELRLGSQCIVREGQLAFFARDGRFLDMLIPGRHTLTSANIPLLVELIKLPFGSKVRVRDVKTGREVSVVITDRGPFTKGRIIDLSHRAAQKLGITGRGIAMVELVAE